MEKLVAVKGYNTEKYYDIYEAGDMPDTCVGLRIARLEGPDAKKNAKDLVESFNASLKK